MAIVNIIFKSDTKMNIIGLENHLSELFIKEPVLRILPSNAVDHLDQLSVLSIERYKHEGCPNKNLQGF